MTLSICPLKVKISLIYNKFQSLIVVSSEDVANYSPFLVNITELIPSICPIKVPIFTLFVKFQIITQPLLSPLAKSCPFGDISIVLT